jgi:outer membrane protein assembly factor BamD (BamD/ComL family)
MELNEIRDKVLQHDMSINNFDNWAQNAEKRIIELEKSRDLMSDVKIALAELKMSNRYLTEKFDELKASVENIIKDNKEQHQLICERVEALEDKPGKRWDTVVVVIITAAVTGVVTFILSQIL